ncbi:MAG: hypothetical protein ACE5HJ_03540 [Thermoplasmata archaeon]
MAEIGSVGDSVVGEKLVAVGRKIGRVFVIADTGAHRAQRVYVWGKPARCYVDRPLRLAQ